MLKRLLLPLLLLTLALTGCVEKKPVSAQLAVADQPFTANFSPEWKVVPISKTPKSIIERTKADGIIFLGGYTSAPTDDFRLPGLLALQSNDGKLSESEILQFSNLTNDLFEGQFGGHGVTITINKKEYDGQRKRLDIDFNAEGSNLTARVLGVVLFTEKGWLIFHGMTAKGDVKGITDIRQIMDSITPDPELQYR